MVHTGARRVSRGGGGQKYFFSGPKCPRRLEIPQRYMTELLSNHMCNVKKREVNECSRFG